MDPNWTPEALGGPSKLVSLHKTRHNTRWTPIEDLALSTLDKKYQALSPEVPWALRTVKIAKELNEQNLGIVARSPTSCAMRLRKLKPEPEARTNPQKVVGARTPRATIGDDESFSSSTPSSSSSGSSDDVIMDEMLATTTVEFENPAVIVENQAPIIEKQVVEVVEKRSALLPPSPSPPVVKHQQKEVSAKKVAVVVRLPPKPQAFKVLRARAPITPKPATPKPQSPAKPQLRQPPKLSKPAQPQPQSQTRSQIQPQTETQSPAPGSRERMLTHEHLIQLISMGSALSRMTEKAWNGSGL